MVNKRCSIGAKSSLRRLCKTHHVFSGSKVTYRMSNDYERDVSATMGAVSALMLVRREA